MNTNKFFKKDFSLMIIGQIVSLFGNTILRFALSMSVLDLTGSVTIFASILAISMIPTLLLSPFGGILADRTNKRNIMVILDFLTFCFITGFAIIFHFTSSIIVIAIIMILLSIIQSFYQPAVQSSIPLLVKEDKLINANGIIIQVNALANLLGPIIGGFLYGFFGLNPIIYVSGICFLFASIMELFIKMPTIKQDKTNGIFSLIKNDFKQAFNFLLHEQKSLFKLFFLLAALNLFLSAMLIVGLPYIVKIFLGLSNQLYGFMEGALGVGSIIGGILAGVIYKKVAFKRSYIFLLIAGIFTIPMGLIIISGNHQLLSYGIIMACVLVVMGAATIFNIYGQTVMQQISPSHILGKLASVISVICMCALPIGQAMYGLLFGWAGSLSFLVVLLSALICIIIAFMTKKALANLKI